jgi:hypothetical protein
MKELEKINFSYFESIKQEFEAIRKENRRKND